MTCISCQHFVENNLLDVAPDLPTFVIVSKRSFYFSTPPSSSINPIISLTMPHRPKAEVDVSALYATGNFPDFSKFPKLWQYAKRPDNTII